jgi:LL-diaminopimelate aminotransferase
MATLNFNCLKLKAGYLFPEIARRVKAFTEANPDAASRMIRCGIGDVTEPLLLAVRQAMHAAIDEMGTREGFHGYGPKQGFEFLRTAIAQHDYRDRGLEVADDEIFVSDGSKCDGSAILDILASDNRVAVMDPVYPVYFDTNVMVGHTGDANEDGSYNGIIYLKCTAENGFVPAIPEEKADIIYLCFPNNQTGAVASRAQLEALVAYARKHGSILLYAAAYEAFVSDPSVPRSICEITGARECAIEFRSFSKNGGFTGTRCAFTVVPKGLTDLCKRGRASPSSPALVQPLHDQVQWSELRHPEGGRHALQREGEGRGRRPSRALHGQCPDPPRGRGLLRAEGLRRRERPLHLG